MGGGHAHLNTCAVFSVFSPRAPDVGYSFETNSGNPFNYFSYGVACSEVEIDCLTGDHKNLRTDIVMDVGSSLNPAIDIGQVSSWGTRVVMDLATGVPHPLLGSPATASCAMSFLSRSEHGTK